MSRIHCRSILFFFFSVIYSVGNAHAQGEANNWYFGDLAGITFNTDPPSALTDGALNAREGCSSISDSGGNLLFYTNGITVWNKNHVIMDNGFGLEGDGLSTQSSLIVKQPGSPNIYYIFTVPDQQSAGAYKYSTVDISLNGGLGSVILKNELMIKDFSDPGSTFTQHTESLTAAFHFNQTDIWVVVHERGVGRFYSYLLNSAGLQSPIISNVGIQGSYLGQCRISPDGRRIALSGYGGSGVQLFDFNSSTGEISNAVTLIGGRIYGLSFSDNSQVLYITDQFADLYQFDLSQPTDAAIINSVLLIASGSGGSYPQLQLGPDGRIYMAQNFRDYLGVIENPNAIGLGCTFVDQGIFLNPDFPAQVRNSLLGLPTFMVNYVTITPVTMADFKGTKQEGINLLSWTTTMEKDASYFQIQKSLDGINFLSIGKVTAAGNSNTLTTYQYPDSEANENAYYRLSTVDIDGTSEYSKIIFVGNESEQIFNIYPNPVDMGIDLIIESNTAVTRVEIFNYLMQEVGKIEDVGHGKQIRFSTTIFEPGAYILKLFSGERITYRKLVIK